MNRSSAGIARRIAVVALAVVTLVSWTFLVRSAAAMSAMSGEGLLVDLAVAMMQPAATGPYLAATALMWLVMMIAMMAPATVPVLLVFLGLDRGPRPGAPLSDGALFTAGYLGVWLGFGLVATVVQWALHRAALLETHLLSAGPVLAGALLVGAGVYQLTPLKAVCLEHCQSPTSFLLGHWRDGPLGALRMGIEHGRHCLGCCWALMLLMFVGGVMSVGAMAILSVFILAERLLPEGPWVARVPGVFLIGWGAWTLLDGRI